jgi:hypothetical protein
MIRISITAAAFDAIAATLPFGSVSFESELNAKRCAILRLIEIEAGQRLAAGGLRGTLLGSEKTDDIGLRRLALDLR